MEAIRKHRFRCCEPVRGGLPIDPDARYAVSVWDHEEQEWEPFADGLRLMELRGVIRHVEALGYSCATYLVEREDD